MASGDKLVLIEAPSNLGLRALRAGHEPGTWRAPEALRQAGLHRALSPVRVESIPRPPYRFEAQPGTRIRNGLEIRSFSECLAAAVSRALERNEFPVVVGGDCSVLLGCLLGARGSGPVGLVHMDGHSDFFHPGNYDTQSRLGSAAGMDLALATGRGEALLATWDGSSLVDDAFVVQIGERDETDRDYAYRDIMQTTIGRIPVREVLQAGIASSLVKALAPVGAERRRLWLHVDLDVLDGAVLPAVDSPGSPGLRYEQLADLLAGFLASKRVLGIDVTIFDPDLDPEGRYARDIVACFARGIGPHLRATRTGT
ncbi:MAG TPA: arginase family protein [Steroidobacteraceae bacterium]|nr:arginase family protein [Steroidobacteraceae bacterium]